jgi:hypothetical protein
VVGKGQPCHELLPVIGRPSGRRKAEEVDEYISSFLGPGGRGLSFSSPRLTSSTSPVCRR